MLHTFLHESHMFNNISIIMKWHPVLASSKNNFQVMGPGFLFLDNCIPLFVHTSVHMCAQNTASLPFVGNVKNLTYFEK